MATKQVCNPGWARFDAWPGIEPAIRVGNLVFTSGATPTEPEGALVGEGDAETQTRQSISNLTAMLDAAGASLDDLVELTVFLVEPTMRGLQWAPALLEFTGQTHVAVTVVGVSSLAFEGQLVEMKAVAVLPD